MFALLCILDRFSSPGCRAILQRSGPEFLRHPVSTGVPQVSHTITAERVNVTVQSVSQSVPTPIKMWRKPGIICPIIGNPDGIWGKFKPPLPVDCCDWPVAVPTLNFGAERLTLTMGESAEKQMSVAPESTMPVASMFWLMGNGMSRVRLKLVL